MRGPYREQAPEPLKAGCGNCGVCWSCLFWIAYLIEYEPPKLPLWKVAP